MIVGIESSFDESACSVINSFGEVLCQGGRDVSFSEPELTEDYTGGVDPRVAETHHKKYLPIAIEKALESIDTSNVEAVAVTLGPGQVGGLNVGLDLALVSFITPISFFIFVLVV